MFNQYLSKQSMASLEFSRMVFDETNTLLPNGQQVMTMREYYSAHDDLIKFLIGDGQ